MTFYDDLTLEERIRIWNKAFTYKHDHPEHVEFLMSKTDYSIAPTGSDLYHPELWKGSHWNWFKGVR